MRVPIACTLTTDDRPTRLEEWRSFFGTHIVTVDRSGSRVRLRLAQGDGPLVAAADLAQREKQCCAFFEFAIELDGAERWLTVGVPTDAEQVLTDLLLLLPDALRS